MSTAAIFNVDSRTAQNGMGINPATDAYELGGDLIRPTTINATATDYLAITGLVAGDPITDNVMVIDPTGIIRYIDPADLTGDFWRTVTVNETPDGVTDPVDNIIREGGVGIGHVNPTTLAAKLDLIGAQVLRPVTLANFPADASVGAAAATVDIASVLVIPQTTQGITLTIPNPSNVQPGRILYVENTGTASFAVNSAAGLQKVFPKSTLAIPWTASGWLPAKIAPYVAPIAIAGNLTLDGVQHHYETLEYNGAANITVTVRIPSLWVFKCPFPRSGRVEFFLLPELG
jgi:hypothetical protein